MADDKVNLPALPEYYRIPLELGRLVLVWGNLEASCHIALQLVVGMPMEESRILVNGLSIETTWEHMIDLLEIQGHHDLAEWLREWRQRAMKLKARRNVAVHSWWLPTGDPIEPYKALDAMSKRARKDIREDTVPGGGAELSSLAGEINAISEEFLVWMKGPLVAVHKHIEPKQPSPDS